MRRILLAILFVFALNVDTNAAPFFGDCDTDENCMYQHSQSILLL